MTHEAREVYRGDELDEGRSPDIMGPHKRYDESEEGYAATQYCDWRLNPWVCKGSSKLGNDQSCLSQVPLSPYVRFGVVKPYHLQCSPGDAGRASRPLRSADTRYDRYAKSVTAVDPGAGWGGSRSQVRSCRLGNPLMCQCAVRQICRIGRRLTFSKKCRVSAYSKLLRMSSHI